MELKMDNNNNNNNNNNKDSNKLITYHHNMSLSKKRDELCIIMQSDLIRPYFICLPNIT